MRVLLDDAGRVQELSLAFGGMSALTQLAVDTGLGLKGLKWDDALVPRACELLAKELPVPPGAPGGMSE